MYLSFILYMISLILISRYWLSNVPTLTMIALLHLLMHVQQPSIEEFSEEYKRHMDKVRKPSVVASVIRAM